MSSISSELKTDRTAALELSCWEFPNDCVYTFRPQVLLRLLESLAETEGSGEAGILLGSANTLNASSVVLEDFIPVPGDPTGHEWFEALRRLRTNTHRLRPVGIYLQDAFPERRGRDRLITGLHFRRDRCLLLRVRLNPEGQACGSASLWQHGVEERGHPGDRQASGHPGRPPRAIPSKRKASYVLCSMPAILLLMMTLLIGMPALLPSALFPDASRSALPLSFTASRVGYAVVYSWNNAATLDARSATLTVQDAGRLQRLPLDPSVLKKGSFVYLSKSFDLTSCLELEYSSGSPQAISARSSGFSAMLSPSFGLSGDDACDPEPVSLAALGTRLASAFGICLPWLYQAPSAYSSDGRRGHEPIGSGGKGRDAHNILPLFFSCPTIPGQARPSGTTRSTD